MVDVIDDVRSQYKEAVKKKKVLTLLPEDCKEIAEALICKATTAGVSRFNGISIVRLQAALDGKISFDGFDFGIGIEFELSEESRQPDLDT